MFLPALTLSIAFMAPQSAKLLSNDVKPVILSRTFAKGEKLEYSIASNLHVEARPYGLQTFIPEDLDLNYKFTAEVKDLKSDGIAVVHYQRPNMVQIEGATFDKP